MCTLFTRCNPVLPSMLSSSLTNFAPFSWLVVHSHWTHLYSPKVVHADSVCCFLQLCISGGGREQECGNPIITVWGDRTYVKEFHHYIMRSKSQKVTLKQSEGRNKSQWGQSNYSEGILENLVRRESKSEIVSFNRMWKRITNEWVPSYQSEGREQRWVGTILK